MRARTRSRPAQLLQKQNPTAKARRTRRFAKILGGWIGLDPGSSAPLRVLRAFAVRSCNSLPRRNGWRSPPPRPRQLPVPRSVELAEVDRLPGPEPEFSALPRDRLRRADHRRLGVRVRIALLVLVILLVPRHRALERVQDVRLHVGVGVLVDGHRAGGVAAED